VKHENWFKSYDSKRVLVLDTSEDFKNNQSKIDEMINQLKNFINQWLINTLIFKFYFYLIYGRFQKRKVVRTFRTWLHEWPQCARWTLPLKIRTIILPVRIYSVQLILHSFRIFWNMGYRNLSFTIHAEWSQQTENWADWPWCIFPLPLTSETVKTTDFHRKGFTDCKILKFGLWYVSVFARLIRF
jgi:hypothetical protein